MQVPKFFKLLFIIAWLGFMFNLFWQNKFYKSYSPQITTSNTQPIKTHGNTYYVNPTEYRNATILNWITYTLFASSIIIFFIIKYKNDPKYFQPRKNSNL